MKKILLSILLLSTVMSCARDENSRIEKLKMEIADLESQNKENEKIINEKDVFVQELVAQLDSINSYFHNFDMQQSEIFRQIYENEEVGLSASEKVDIEKKLDQLNDYLNKQEEKIGILQNRIDSEFRKSESLSTIIVSYKRRLEEKNKTIEELYTEIDKLNQKYELAQQQISSQEKELAATREEISTLSDTYFVVGTPQQLRDLEFTRKYLGKTLFNSIDRAKMRKSNNKTDKIFLGYDVKDFKIFTQHSSFPELYTFQDSPKEDYLILKDAEKFWGIQKDLVIEIKY